jgi:molybdopterin-containing oxidoreductase family iron-sulfur binding subunit
MSGSDRGIDRRSFFKIVATSGAAAAASGCSRPPEALLSMVTPPEEVVPGIAAFFSTVCRECPAGCGVLAKNRDGRIVKVEGNPIHPLNAGALCIRGQASLQGLYHPDRFRGALVGGKPAPWDAAERQVAEKIGALAGAGQGGKIALVSGLETGSLARLMDEWGRALGARPRVAYEPLGYEAMRAANRLTFGRDAIPHYAIGEAAYLVSFGADFIETWLQPVGYAGEFSRMHGFGNGRAGTAVHIEPRLSLTAASADVWIRNNPGTEGLLALALLRVILEEGWTAAGPEMAVLRAAVGNVDVAAVASASGVTAEVIKRLAHDLATSKGGVAVGGGMGVASANATETQVAINLLNVALGAVGTRVRFGGDSAFGKVSPYTDMLALTAAMAKGEIEVLILAGVNPVFTMPAASGFADAVGKVPLVVSLSNRPNETTARASVVLPALHPFESWGDYVAEDGVIGLMQPTMGPVQIDGKAVDGKSVGDILLSVGRLALHQEPGKGPLRWGSFEEFLKEQWTALGKDYGSGQSFVEFWQASLERGGAWRTTPTAAVSTRPEAGRMGGAAAKLEGSGSHALLVYPSMRFYDGRGADQPWLQEAPDTMTQITWDGWVEVPAATAAQLDLRRGDLVKLTSPFGSIELPAYPSDSLHPESVAVAMGQGHEYSGEYARQRGVNTGANPMLLLGARPEEASGALPYLAVKVALAKTGARRPLAIPQATQNQDDREIAQLVQLGAARELELRGRAPEHASHPSMYPPVKYPDYRWGMTVDVDLCTGCQACVVACAAENNVPVVGKAQVAYGRDQHWLRLERWQEGASDHPENVFLPMFCQHCEIAPCEPVCPVYAAYHTREGLNAQVYNRCVGTRYCGNNCPYHVRRFNWFNYTWPSPLDVQLNPDVTVRQLGIMEKCTMCIQRIGYGKDRAGQEGRAVKDGEVLTACQQTCPTQAITFGNLKDGGSRVSKLSRSPRSYHVLEELGTRPAVTYLKKVVRSAEGSAEKGHTA